MNPAPRRVALCGFFLECNRWAPVTTGEDFNGTCDLAGAALGDALRQEPPRLLGDTVGFVAAMDALGPWEPVPLRLAAACPGGPAEQSWFEALLDDISTRLRAAGPLDGVFISSHGAALTTGNDDPDGVLFAQIRALVGPAVPVVAVLDLHTNVSRRMTDALSGFVAYRTNPHVDLRERGAEAAGLMHQFWRNGPGTVVLERLPLVAPAPAQLIAPGTVYDRLIALGQQAIDDDILNVSLCGGFALADCPKCGFAVVVTTRQGASGAGRQTARRLAEAVWAARAEFTARLTPLADAVAMAVAAGRDGPPLILADVGDNPGGGGGGNTVTLLRALLQANAQGVVLGVFTDTALAAEACALAPGARFTARFNRRANGAFAEPFDHPATVLAVSDGRFTGERGMLRGIAQRMGPSALLDLGGVRVAVVSLRQQLLDPAQLKTLGEDLSQARILVAKSRGHFRAGFDQFAPPGRIVEVDAPGLTTPNLAILPWTRLPRPVFPVDPDATWSGATP
jgi:microcystin degradation protein MlrC